MKTLEELLEYGIWVCLMAAAALVLMTLMGCTRISVPGVGSYTRFGTDFDGRLVKTSDTLTLEIGSHLNDNLVEVPASVLRSIPLGP